MSERYGRYGLFVPPQAVGASTVYFDLWNGSDRALKVSSVEAIKDGSSAVTGTLAVDMFLTRTSTVGTGGTAATEEGTSLAACTITKLDTVALPTGVSARLTPSAGATAGAVIRQRQIFGEETNAANYQPVEFLPSLINVAAGSGIRVVQGTVASAGAIGFSVVFY